MQTYWSGQESGPANPRPLTLDDPFAMLECEQSTVRPGGELACVISARAGNSNDWVFTPSTWLYTTSMDEADVSGPRPQDFSDEPEGARQVVPAGQRARIPVRIRIPWNVPVNHVDGGRVPGSPTLILELWASHGRGKAQYDVGTVVPQVEPAAPQQELFDLCARFGYRATGISQIRRDAHTLAFANGSRELSVRLSVSAQGLTIIQVMGEPVEHHGPWQDLLAPHLGSESP